VKSSRGGTYDGRGAPLVFVAGMNFLLELLMSGLRASSSRSIWRSYRIEERTCSTRAVVTSSVTSFLCLSRARCKFCEMPSARFARIISYLFASSMSSSASSTFSALMLLLAFSRSRVRRLEIDALTAA